MMHVGGYLEYRGGCSVLWGNHDKCGGIMINVGEYLEYSGGVQCYGGKIFCYLSTPTVLNTPQIHDIPLLQRMVSPHMHHDTPPGYSR